MFSLTFRNEPRKGNKVLSNATWIPYVSVNVLASERKAFSVRSATSPGRMSSGPTMRWSMCLPLVTGMFEVGTLPELEPWMHVAPTHICTDDQTTYSVPP